MHDSNLNVASFWQEEGEIHTLPSTSSSLCVYLRRSREVWLSVSGWFVRISRIWQLKLAVRSVVRAHAHLSLPFSEQNRVLLYIHFSIIWWHVWSHVSSHSISDLQESDLAIFYWNMSRYFSLGIFFFLQSSTSLVPIKHSISSKTLLDHHPPGMSQEMNQYWLEHFPPFSILWHNFSQPDMSHDINKQIEVPHHIWHCCLSVNQMMLKLFTELL